LEPSYHSPDKWDMGGQVPPRSSKALNSRKHRVMTGQVTEYTYITRLSRIFMYTSPRLHYDYSHRPSSLLTTRPSDTVESRFLDARSSELSGGERDRLSLLRGSRVGEMGEDGTGGGANYVATMQKQNGIRVSRRRTEESSSCD
jgi:hypothetical protein